MTFTEAYHKLSRYCAYQDRCMQDVQEKIKELEIPQGQALMIIEQLQEEDFLNEDRFVCSFAHGKFSHLKWGRKKIVYELRQKGISQLLIDKGLESIDEDEYLAMLESLIERKRDTLPRAENVWKLRQQLTSYALQKGYENDLVQKAIAKVMQQNS
jgi:regulatory protein